MITKIFWQTFVSYYSIGEFLHYKYLFIGMPNQTAFGGDKALLTDTLSGRFSVHRTSLKFSSVGFQFKNSGECTGGTDIVCRAVFLQRMKVSNTGSLPVYLN